MNLFSFLGGSIFVTAGQALLEEQLAKNLKPILPDLDASSLANGGATTIRNMVTADQLPAVLVAYNDAIRNIWYLGLGLACLVLLASCGFEWKSVKPSKKQDELEKGDSGPAVESQGLEPKDEQSGHLVRSR